MLRPIATSNRHSELACSSWTATDAATAGAEDAACQSAVVFNKISGDVCKLTVGAACPSPGIATPES
jgi:hypothetical protein